MKQSKFKFIDLFSGLGGFRIALESLGGECVFSSDNDKFVNEVYRQNFGVLPTGDITTVPNSEIPDHNILCAGFPCQPFSIGGYRKGFSDTRGTLFFEIERILRTKKPEAFILENVKGLVSHDSGNTLNTILKTLSKTVNGIKYNHPKNLGYHVNFKILNSKDFGVPQSRERIFIVGIRNPKNKFIFPDGKNIPEKKLIDILFSYDDKKNEYRVGTNVSSQIFKHLEAKKDKFKLDPQVPLIAYEVRPSRCSFRQDGLSQTLTAKMGTGGNNVPIYVQEMRKLTIRECLDIQGYPKSYIEVPQGMQSYKQIGNSLTVPVVKEIAKNILKVL